MPLCRGNRDYFLRKLWCSELTSSLSTLTQGHGKCVCACVCKYTCILSFYKPEPICVCCVVCFRGCQMNSKASFVSMRLLKVSVLLSSRRPSSRSTLYRPRSERARPGTRYHFPLRHSTFLQVFQFLHYWTIADRVDYVFNVKKIKTKIKHLNERLAYKVFLNMITSFVNCYILYNV